MKAGLFVTGIVLIVLGIIGYIYPISDYGSVSDLHEICTSGLGQLGKIFSGDVRENCQNIKAILIGTYAFMGIGAILVIIGSVLKQDSSRPPKPLSKKTRNGIAIGIGVVVAVGLGVFVYYSTLQPDIQVLNVNVVPTQSEELVKVLDHGRVSGMESFYYTSKDGGTYHLAFSNDFSFISTKYVGVQYTDKGETQYQEFSVPAGSYRTISVYAYPNQAIFGTFAVEGGSGDDVDFAIYKQECKQNVKFSFDLANYGVVDGNALVNFLKDGNSIWSDTYFVESGRQISKSGSVIVEDCNFHEYKMIVSRQQRTE